MEVIKLEDDDAIDNDLVLPQPQQPPQLSIAVMILVPYRFHQNRRATCPSQQAVPCGLMLDTKD
jgi:hypothetical protein